MAEKPQKCHKISCISVCAFCSISITNIATPPTFFNTFTLNFEISFSTKFGSYFTVRFFKFRIWLHFGAIFRSYTPAQKNIQWVLASSVKTNSSQGPSGSYTARTSLTSSHHCCGVLVSTLMYTINAHRRRNFLKWWLL